MASGPRWQEELTEFGISGLLLLMCRLRVPQWRVKFYKVFFDGQLHARMNAEAPVGTPACRPTGSDVPAAASVATPAAPAVPAAPAMPAAPAPPAVPALPASADVVFKRQAPMKINSRAPVAKRRRISTKRPAGHSSGSDVPAATSLATQPAVTAPDAPAAPAAEDMLAAPATQPAVTAPDAPAAPAAQDMLAQTAPAAPDMLQTPSAQACLGLLQTCSRHAPDMLQTCSRLLGLCRRRPAGCSRLRRLLRLCRLLQTCWLLRPHNLL